MHVQACMAPGTCTPTPPPCRCPSAAPGLATMQLLKPAAAAKYAAEVRYDPKAQPQLAFGVRATITGARCAVRLLCAGLGVARRMLAGAPAC